MTRFRCKYAYLSRRWSKNATVLKLIALERFQHLKCLLKVIQGNLFDKLLVLKVRGYAYEKIGYVKIRAYGLVCRATIRPDVTLLNTTSCADATRSDVAIKRYLQLLMSGVTSDGCIHAC